MYLYIEVPRSSMLLGVTVDKNIHHRKEFQNSWLLYDLHTVVKSAREEGFSNSKHGCRLLVTIHNAPKPTKSHTTLKDLLKHLNKTALILIAEILKKFSRFLPFKTNEKYLTFLD